MGEIQELAGPAARVGRWDGARRILSKAAALLILAGVGTGAGMLLTPGLSPQQIPYGDNNLGQIATATIKATRDYAIPDEESTRRKREAAVAQVRPVYDLDGKALSEVDSRIREGFAAMRSALATTLPEEPRKPMQLDGLRQELVSKLQTMIEPRDFEALLKEGFSPVAEQAERDLVSREMARMLLGDRGLLGNDRVRGIFVRPLPEGTPGAEAITDLDAIRDLAAARADVERAAMDVPGDLGPAVRRALGRMARGALRPNLTYDSAETERRRIEAYRSVGPVVIQLKKGEKIIGDGDRIEERHLLAFRGMRDQAQPFDLSQTRLGSGLLAILLSFLCYRFGRRQFRRFQPGRKDALFLGLALLGELALEGALSSAGGLLGIHAVWIPSEVLAYAAPVAAGTMLVRLLLEPELALLFAIVSATLFGWLEGGSLPLTLFALAGSVVGADHVAGAQSRGALFRAGSWVALSNAAVVGCLSLLGGRLLSPEVGTEVVAGLLGGALFTPMLLLALTPLVEGVFGYTTNARLLELSNLNQPALKDLIVRAPGTYHHSILLGSLAEAAATSIGANPLLARVSAYYHDIGKGKNPLCFAENQKGQNRHDLLPPEESAALIRQHVADGLELARQYKLPRVIADAIPQHHGTRLIGNFYQKALKLHRGSEDGTVEPSLDERPFRYAGPKPRRPETALVMLADGVEAASRSLPQATPETLGILVRKIIDGVFSEGQLDECDLTLRDLTRVTQSFQSTLEALYHSRPTYPLDAVPNARSPLSISPSKDRTEPPRRLDLN